MTPEEHDYQVEKEESRRENDAMIKTVWGEEQQIQVNKQTITNMLFRTERKGIHELSAYLLESDFYTIPASKRYHNTEKGGLAKHCLSVYSLFYNHIQKLGIKDIPHDSIVICSLLHDLCKITPKMEEHAKVSILRIEQFIKLTELEKQIIKYHMGYYAAGNRYNAEYSMDNLQTAQNNPIIKLFHWCDDMDAQFIGVKK